MANRPDFSDIDDFVRQQSGPPSSLWKGREGKVLTIKMPHGGTEKWQLKQGIPTKVQ